MPAKVQDIEKMRNKLNEFQSVYAAEGDTNLSFNLGDECLTILIIIGKEEIYELKNDVYKLLSCDDEFVRNEAVITLGSPNRLGLPEFKDKAFEIFLMDSSDMVRASALSVWCDYYRKSKDKEVLKKLYCILKEEKYSIEIRTEANCSIFTTVNLHSSLERMNEFDKLFDCETNAEFNAKVNWGAIRDIMRLYAPEALKDEEK